MGSTEKKLSYSLEVYGERGQGMRTKLKHSNCIHFAILSPKKLAVKLIDSKRVLLNLNNISFQEAAEKKASKQARKKIQLPCLSLHNIALLNLSLQALSRANKL